MANINPDELWFSTPDAHTLCRMGGNGPAHPSQLYAIKKYVKEGMSFLDYGAGSGTTYEAIIKEYGGMPFVYCGVDVIPKFTKWCKKTFPDGKWFVNKEIHKISDKDKNWDVVFSRHVVDHMESFEKAMDEHCRVAKKLVIVVLWIPLGNGDEHSIKNIIDQQGLPTEKLYKNEYTNCYSRKKVLEYLNNKKGWKLLELTEGIKNGGDQGAANNDVVIVLENE